MLREVNITKIASSLRLPIRLFPAPLSVTVPTSSDCSACEIRQSLGAYRSMKSQETWRGQLSAISVCLTYTVFLGVGIGLENCRRPWHGCKAGTAVQESLEFVWRISLFLRNFSQNNS